MGVRGKGSGRIGFRVQGEGVRGRGSGFRETGFRKTGFRETGKEGSVYRIKRLSINSSIFFFICPSVLEIFPEP
jgi:hypothetical protein